MKNIVPFWNKTAYCLIVLKKNGESVRHYYETYDKMLSDSIYIEYSPVCVKARGMVFDKCGLFKYRWKTAFRIG